TLDEAARDVGVDLIGGFTALVQKGMTRGEQVYLRFCRKFWRKPNAYARRSTPLRRARRCTWTRCCARPKR
ncbi:MAG: DUF711 family protein, partial [Verrucomicrobiae bacterium]|nr:DUF711 family protein [Verrucomicrobiae bacterium]